MTGSDAAFAFRCACCGEVITGIPDFGFDRPIYWNDETESEIGTNWLSADMCVIEKCGFFVRGILEMAILETPRRLGLGVWTTLSEPNFNRYSETFSREQESLGPMS